MAAALGVGVAGFALVGLAQAAPAAATAPVPTPPAPPSVVPPPAPPPPPTTIPPSTIAAPAIPTSSSTVPAAVTAGLAPPLGLPPAAAWTLVDVGNGRVLNQSHEHLDLPPASLTKMLTALVATAYLPAGTLLAISPRAANVEPDKVGMKVGELWPVSSALQSLLIVSANDAAYAIAEKVGGTAEAFAPVLQSAAAQVGMADHPLYRDPAGLDDAQSLSGGNLVSARDLAISARDLLAEPELAAIVPQAHLDITGPSGTVYHLASHNRGFLGSYPGAVGIKTGYTVKAGICIAAAATRYGRTMLAVVLHGVNPDQTAKMLLDEGFATPVAGEPTADVLPPVHLPTATADPGSPVAAAPGAGGGVVARHVASGPAGLDPAILRPEGSATLGSMWPAPIAALLLIVTGMATLRLAHTRRRPLTHGRRT